MRTRCGCWPSPAIGAQPAWPCCARRAVIGRRRLPSGDRERPFAFIGATTAARRCAWRSCRERRWCLLRRFQRDGGAIRPSSVEERGLSSMTADDAPSVTLLLLARTQQMRVITSSSSRSRISPSVTTLFFSFLLWGFLPLLPRLVFSFFSLLLGFFLLFGSGRFLVGLFSFFFFLFFSRPWPEDLREPTSTVTSGGDQVDGTTARFVGTPPHEAMTPRARPSMRESRADTVARNSPPLGAPWPVSRQDGRPRPARRHLPACGGTRR